MREGLVAPLIDAVHLQYLLGMGSDLLTMNLITLMAFINAEFGLCFLCRYRPYSTNIKNVRYKRTVPKVTLSNRESLLITCNHQSFQK